MADQMTKAEREELAKLVRRREKLAKAAASQRAAEMMADFESQVATDYHLNDQAVWEEAHAAVAAVVDQANERIAERCRELGIPDRFAPSIAAGWFSRGEHAARSRVEELRKVARTRFAALEKAAKTEIERHSVDVQTELVAGGLQSAEARAFLESMPTAEALMPAPSVREIEAAAGDR